MSSPGWYPDPAGQPNRFRFWDGQTWSEQTTDNPYVAPPPGMQQPPQPPRPPAMPPATRPPAGPQGPPPQAGPQPVQPPRPPQPSGPLSGPPSGPPNESPSESPTQFGQRPAAPPGQWSPTPQEWAPGGSWSPMPQQGGQQGGPGAQPGGRKGLWIALGAVLLVLLIVGGGVAAAFALRGDDSNDRADDERTSESTDGDSDETDATDETDETEPTEESTEPLETCPVGDPSEQRTHAPDGRVHGGGISFRAPKGFKEGQNATQFEWMYDVSGVEKVTERTANSGWISMIVAGEVRRSDGYTSPEQAAVSIVSCMAGSDRMYGGFESDRELSSKRISVDGHEAWEIRQEIRIDEPELQVKGDTAIVIVVDNGSDDTFSVFAGVTPLGNRNLLSVLERTAAGVTLD